MNQVTGMRKEEWNRDYDRIFSEGALVSHVEILSNIVRISEEDPTSMPKETLEKIFDGQPGYYDEIIGIIHKYPNYESQHLARKIIFECTWLPYTIYTESG